MAKIFIMQHHYVELQMTPTECSALLEHVSGIHKLSRKDDTYRCSLKLLPDVLFYLRGWTVDNVPEGLAKESLEHELTRRTMTAELKQHGTDVVYPGLWKHQNLGVELARYNDRYNFFYDTRTGKTRMAFQIIQNALEVGKIHRALVIVPATIISSWLEDSQQFPMKVAAYYGDARRKADALSTPCHIMLWSTGMVVNEIELIQRCKFDMVILDESSKCKSRTTKLAQALMDYATTVPYWYNLSATPAPNGEYEYFAQMQFVDRYMFNPVWTHFKNKYFDNISYSPKFEKLALKGNMRQEFMDCVEQCSIYIDQSVMPMAETEWHTWSFCLEPDIFAYYEDMRKKMSADIGDAEIVVDTAVIARAKLQQICSGFIMDTDARTQNSLNRKLELEATEQEVYVLPGPNKRLEALQQLLSALGGQQILIWAHYGQEFADIKALLGDACRVINGKTPTMLKNEYVAAFKAREFQYLVAHPLSLGMGVNLTVAHSCIYYRVTDSWEALKQSSERIKAHKNIQPFKCDYYVLLAVSPTDESLVDSLVYDNVTNKRDASTDFLNYLRSGHYDGETVCDNAVPHQTESTGQDIPYRSPLPPAYY